jgi:arylsulfatase A-like enzyme
MSSPNVLLVLLDDVGFGAPSAFGGPCRTPTAERLAAGGLKYVRFHTTGLCSPTRASLLTGRNHHAVGFGSLTETATAAPGYNSLRPRTCVPLPEILSRNGYATAQFGKCHEVPVWQASSSGPFDYWPTRSGFHHFYGFVAAETNQWFPALFDGTSPVTPPPQVDDSHLTAELADKAIEWISRRHAEHPAEPFFVYFTPGATHAPHHVPRMWADKYKRRFNAGWDRVRRDTFARQKRLGIIPPECALTPRPADIPAWDVMADAVKPVLRRQMEIYAGYLEYADYHVGRIIDALGEMDVLDDTLVIYIMGDNGASAEGTVNGTFGEAPRADGRFPREAPEFLVQNLEKLGGPDAYNHYAIGWAHAMCTPYQWTKQVASHWGATRNGAIVHWPRGIAARGEIRTQFCHVTDVMPTILDAAGIRPPSEIGGVKQKPLHGTSMRYSFEDRNARERHDTQYFEIFGNRAIYHRGWSAAARHRTPWEASSIASSFEDDVWELYDGVRDWSQAQDLADAMPLKLAQLQRVFVAEARRFHVFPLDDRERERLDPDVAGRPTHGRRLSEVIYPGMGRLTQRATVSVLNRSHSVIADIIVRKGDGGVIVNQGGAAGGWALSLQDRHPTYSYNFAGVKTSTIAAPEPLPPGRHVLRVQFAYDGEGRGKGGVARLFVDGAFAGAVRVPRTHEVSFWPLPEQRNAPRGVATRLNPVVEDRRFSGVVKSVRVTLGTDPDDEPSHRPAPRASVLQARPDAADYRRRPPPPALGR